MAFIPNQAFADRSLSMRSLHIDAQLLPDASMRVTEKITVEFNEQWNGFYVKIPEGTTPIVDVSVSESGQPYTYNPSTEYGPPGTFLTKKEGSDILIDWSIDAYDQTRTFELSYTVVNAVKIHNDVAELYRKFVGDANGNKINDVQVNLSLPSGAESYIQGKENADALMNSNDHIMEKISMLEAVLSDNVSHPAPETNKNDSAYAQNILDNQNKILQQLEVLQNTLNTIGADAKIAAESAKQNFFTEERILAEENKIEKEEPQVQEAAVEEIPSAAGEATVMEETPIEEEPSVMEETPIEEEPSVMEETPIEEVPSDMEETSIGKEEVSSPEEDLSKYDDIMVDTLTDSDDNVPVEKIPLEDETVVDDEPAMPDLSDPNKVMTPDEIAALIANL